MTEQRNANTFSHVEDTRLHRLWNPKTKCYLHLSGSGETPDVNQSWLGFMYQAENLANRAHENGERWPYRRRHRNAHMVKIEQKENEF